MKKKKFVHITMNKFVGIEQIRAFVLNKIRTNYNKLQWEIPLWVLKKVKEVEIRGFCSRVLKKVEDKQ